jgi:protein involved in polysaccharide export with SLBB domain
MEGMVTRPGHYYLPQGAFVRDAVEVAGGLSERVWWRGYSGIERQRPDGTLEVYKVFKGRKAAEEIALKSGDVLFFGHEVY